VAARLVDVLLGLEHGLVGDVDLVAGAWVELDAAVGRLEIGDRLVDLGEAPLGRRQLVGRRGIGQGRLDALELAVDLDPLTGELAGHQIGLAHPGVVVEVGQRVAQRATVDHRRLDARHELGPLVEDVVAGGGAGRGGLLDRTQYVAGLGVGQLGVLQGVVGHLELAAQRRFVELGGLEVAQLARRVVDHLPRGLALLLDEDELAARRLDVGAAGVEGAARLLGGVGELARALEQGVAVVEVGAHAPGPGGGLVAAVGGDRLQLAGAAELGGQLAAQALVVLDPAQCSLAGGGGEVGGAERGAERRRRIAAGALQEPCQLLCQTGTVTGVGRDDRQSPVQTRQLARSAHVSRRSFSGGDWSWMRSPRGPSPVW
jgi:hypothetical protein